MKELKTWRDVIQALLDGEEVEYLDGPTKRWIKLTCLPCPNVSELSCPHNNALRIKPRTIMIGDMEVPEPVRDASELEEGEVYYFICPTDEDLYDFYAWDGDALDLRLLKHGMIHKTKEDDILHAKALIKISGGHHAM